MSRILLSGASGFIGSHLMPFLQKRGHEVIRLSRRRQDAGSVYWDPIHGNFQKDQFEGFDTVIHLAGASIVSTRWTKKKKEELFLSRCRDTWLLSEVLCRLYQPPTTVITASAIGYYGSRGDQELTEESSRGEGFLANLVSKWEEATSAIENRGARVVHPRFGVVLGAEGGTLKKILPLFKWGLGGKIGSGKQIMSWVSIDDVLGAIDHILMTEALSGPVNVVAPNPVPQEEFTRLLAKKLGRPAFCNMPEWVLKGLFGEMAKETLLSSAKVKPVKLLRSGYLFRYPDLQSALDHIL